MSATPLSRPSLRDVPLYAPDASACAVDLRDNTNLWGAPPHAVEAVRGAAPSLLSLYPAVSGGRLSEALARQIGVDVSEVAVGCGSDDLLDAAFRAVAEPGSVVAHPAPSFSMVPIFARLNGLEPAAVPLTRDGAADVDAMLAVNARIIYLCSPNNPTGTVTPADVVRRVLRESDAIVVLDGAYAEFDAGAEDLLCEAPAQERLLVLRTFSKAWGLAGLRVGYAVGSAPLIRAVRQSSGPYKLNALGELAATTALEQDGAWMRECASEAARCRDRLAEALRSLGLSPLASRGNFVAVPVPDARRYAAALATRGYAVRAFTGLPVYGDLIRIGVAPWPVLEGLVRAWQDVLA